MATTTSGLLHNQVFHPSTILSSTASTASTEATPTTTSNCYDSFNPVPVEECEEILQTVEKAARAAGDIIMEHLGCSSETSTERSDGTAEIKTNIKDVVTKYDKLAQEVIEQIIKEKYDNFYFLGEENVAAGGEASKQALVAALENSKLNSEDSTGSSDNAKISTGPGFTIIVDPIDGTANFASGLPLCAVTMSIVYQDTPIVGIVYDPHRDEFFHSIRGQGTWLSTMGGERTHLKVQTAISSAKDAIVNAGCPADPNAFETSMKGMLALNSRVRGLRVVACSALTLAWIASGRLTAHFGYDLSSWDLVAGALMIQEAGGHITDIDGSPYTIETRNMLCSNGKVHDEILDVLKDAGATSFTRADAL
ncbi:MAG: hypothetical protein SGILL_002298 [Bacillariaceae sp.]